MESLINTHLKDFISGYSIEVIPKTVAKTDSFGDILPKNTRVYLAHLKDEQFLLILFYKNILCKHQVQ